MRIFWGWHKKGGIKKKPMVPGQYPRFCSLNHRPTIARHLAQLVRYWKNYRNIGQYLYSFLSSQRPELKCLPSPTQLTLISLDMSAEKPKSPDLHYYFSMLNFEFFNSSDPFFFRFSATTKGPFYFLI